MFSSTHAERISALTLQDWIYRRYKYSSFSLKKKKTSLKPTFSIMARCLFGRILTKTPHVFPSKTVKGFKHESYCLAKHFALIWTLKLNLYNEAKFWHISLADTTTIKEDNTTDQKTPLLPAFVPCICRYVSHPLQHRAVCHTSHVCTGVVVPSVL